MAAQDTDGPNPAAPRPGGSLLWLWLLLGAVALTLALWAVAQLLDDGDELQEQLPATTEQPATAGTSAAAPPAPARPS